MEVFLLFWLSVHVAVWKGVLLGPETPGGSCLRVMWSSAQEPGPCFVWFLFFKLNTDQLEFRNTWMPMDFEIGFKKLWSGIQRPGFNYSSHQPYTLSWEVGGRHRHQTGFSEPGHQASHEDASYVRW